MKHQGYYDRALKASDPRYARVFNKMGYGTRDLKGDEAPSGDGDGDLGKVREEYHQVLGKRPYHAWTIEELREKIVAAREANGD